MQPAPENCWGLFVTGTGQFVSVGDDDENARGYDITTGGFTVGLDYRICPSFAIGLDAGYARSDAHQVNRGQVTADGGKLGVYATWFSGGFYLDGAVSGGYNSYDTRRSALLGQARGSTNGAEFNGLIGGGYDWKSGRWSFGPVATFQYSYISFDGFTEDGSLAPLAFPDQSEDSERGTLGLKASYDWKVGGAIVRHEVRAGWQHEFGDPAYPIDSRFASGAGGIFTVNGPEIGRDSAVIDAGLAVLWSERISTYLNYDGQLGRDNYASHSVSGGFRVNF
jgi:outer membrane autotransporter protein